MNILPISDYPAPSDTNSQMQVLNEEKGEVNRKIEKLSNSRLDRKAKEVAVNSLRARRDSIDIEIRHKRVEKQVKDKIEAKRREEKKVVNEQLKKQEKDTSKSSLDVRA